MINACISAQINYEMYAISLLNYLLENHKNVAASSFWFVGFLCVVFLFVSYDHIYIRFLPFSLLIQGWHSTNFLEYKMQNCSRYSKWHQLFA